MQFQIPEITTIMDSTDSLVYERLRRKFHNNKKFVVNFYSFWISSITKIYKIWTLIQNISLNNTVYFFLATTTTTATTSTVTTTTISNNGLRGGALSVNDDAEAHRMSDTDRPLIEALMQNEQTKRRHACTGRFLTMHKRRRKKLNTRGIVTVPAILDDILNGLTWYILDHVGNWSFNAFILENVSGGKIF